MTRKGQGRDITRGRRHNDCYIWRKEEDEEAKRVRPKEKTRKMPRKKQENVRRRGKSRRSKSKTREEERKAEEAKKKKKTPKKDRCTGRNRKKPCKQEQKSKRRIRIMHTEYRDSRVNKKKTKKNAY
jgi:hypothetical protein